MRKIVLTFGLISGAIVSLIMVLALVVQGCDRVRSGRDRRLHVDGRRLSVHLLRRAGVPGQRGGWHGELWPRFAVGSLIAVLASLCYVATWEVIYYNFAPDFIEKYREHAIAKAHADGESEAAIAEKTAKMDQLAELYKNPAINAAITFLEPLPVAMIVALVSAGVLSRRKKSDQGVRALERQQA